MGLILVNSTLILNADNPKKSPELLTKMFEVIDEMQALSYNGYINSRINGQLKAQQGEFKVVKAPFKFYFKKEFPEEGQQVLFSAGMNGDKAIVKTGSFPWVKVNLDPESKLMRNDNHHSLYNSGYWYFNDIVRHLINKNKGVITYLGIENFKGSNCHKIQIVNANYKLEKYIIKDGESLISIAKQKRINDYNIVELNSEIKDLFDYQVGQEIMLPNDYAKKMVLYLNEDYLPVGIYVYDHIGLYEELVFTKIKVNPVIEPKEFTLEYKNYHF